MVWGLEKEQLRLSPDTWVVGGDGEVVRCMWPCGVREALNTGVEVPGRHQRGAAGEAVGHVDLSNQGWRSK